MGEKSSQKRQLSPGHSYESEGYDTTGTQGSAVDYDTDAQDALAGDSEWSQMYDAGSEAYYWYNNIMGEASWTSPEDQGVDFSAEEWVSYMDEEGKEYWYNSVDGRTTYDSPF